MSRNRIERTVTVCGERRCVKARALVDTGASITTLTDGLAKRVGIRSRANGTVVGVGGQVKAYGGTAKVCLTDKGCGCLTGPVAVIKTKEFAGTDLLLGQDYLSAARAMIDTHQRSIECQIRRMKKGQR